MPNDTPQLLTPTEFAAKVKAQYPDYAHIPDEELTQKVIAKYPEYSQKVRMAPIPGASTMKGVPSHTSAATAAIGAVAGGMMTTPSTIKQGVTKALDKMGGSKLAEFEKKHPTFGPAMQMAMGAESPESVAGIVERLPSKAHAGEMLENVAKQMANTPVRLNKSKVAAQAAADVISHGGKSSKLVTDFLDHIGENNTMTWKDARDFISNASSRSRLAELFEGQTGHARYAIGQFVGQLGDEIKASAASMGQGEDYQAALKEYRNAARISRALKASVVIGGAYAFQKLTSAKANSAVKSIWSALE